MAFYASKRQVEGGDIPEVDTVEVRFRGSNDDQGRKGAVLLKMNSGGRKGGNAVELLQELYRIHGGRSDLPLMAYRGCGGW